MFSGEEPHESQRDTHTHVNKVEDWSKVAAKRLVSLEPHPDIHA